MGPVMRVNLQHLHVALVSASHAPLEVKRMAVPVAMPGVKLKPVANPQSEGCVRRLVTARCLAAAGRQTVVKWEAEVMPPGAP